MCTKCGIKNSTIVGTIVKIVRRCQTRTGIDKGQHLADKQALVYVTKIATRGEGFYGRVINVHTNKLMNTNAHFRECEHEQTSYTWCNELV